MDPQTSVSPSGIEAALRDLKPVAVTRWSARLADPQCERDYRIQRFADDRRRLLLLMGLVAAAAVLIFLGRLYEYWYYGSAAEPLYPPLVSIFIPLCGIAIFRRLNTPQSLELAVLAVGSVGCCIRLLLLTLQPGLLAMWLPLMVTMLFVIYLYLPLRFTAAVALCRDILVGHAVLVGVGGASGAAGPGNLSRVSVAAARQRARLHRRQCPAAQSTHAVRAEPAAAQAAVDRLVDRHRQPPPLRRGARCANGGAASAPACRCRC